MAPVAARTEHNGWAEAPHIRPDWRPTPAQLVQLALTIAEGHPVHPRWRPWWPAAVRMLAERRRAA